MKIFFFILSLILLQIPCNSQTVKPENDHRIDSLIEIKKINKQCIIIKFGSDAITAIDTDNGIIVIDAGISSGLTLRYRKIIEDYIHKKDFIYLINTHYHSDHYGGNCIFNSTVIIGQVNCIEEISQQSKSQGKRIQSLRNILNEYEIKINTFKEYSEDWVNYYTKRAIYSSALNDALDSIALKYPDITFEDSLSLYPGNITLELIYFGKCHSNSDILIFVPQMKTLFIGDLFSKYGRIHKDESLTMDKNRSLHSVEWLEKKRNNIKTIIGGHGEVLSYDDLKRFISNVKQIFKSMSVEMNNSIKTTLPYSL